MKEEVGNLAMMAAEQILEKELSLRPMKRLSTRLLRRLTKTMELMIAMTYGRALFDAAVELDKIDEIKEEIDQIDGILKRNRTTSACCVIQQFLL